MPSVIISSSEESESDAFSIEKQSDESMSQTIVESDSEEVFASDDDEEPQKGKSLEMGLGNELEAKKSTQKVTVKQENVPGKRNASNLINVKEENESGAKKRKRNYQTKETRH